MKNFLFAFDYKWEMLKWMQTTHHQVVKCVNSSVEHSDYLHKNISIWSLYKTAKVGSIVSLILNQSLLKQT